MTEFLEKVAIGLEKAISSDPYCEQKKSPTNWSATIDGLKGKGDPAILKTNLLKEFSDPLDGLPKLSAGWDLTKCNPLRFPVQSHHLVPEKQLPKHQVTFWLIKNSKKKHKKYKLAADTSYDTNHEMNGYFMPFASTTHQWSKAPNAGQENKVCFEMMRLTRLQLHQGPHSKSDYLEEEKIETAGYKEMVKKLLNVIAERTEKHVDGCAVCKDKGKPIEVQPLEATVRHMYRVSKTLKGLIVLNRIFVSKRAANYYNKYRQGTFMVHPSQPLI